MIKLALGAFFTSSAGAIAKRVLVSLGFGIISYAAVATALASAIGYAQSAYGGLPAYVAALAGLGGIGQGLGIIAAAMTFRVSVVAVKKLALMPS